MYKVHLLPATFGDSILIEYGEQTSCYILIDGGPFYAFKNILSAVKKLAPGLKELELLVVTHIDIDHIDGTITLLNHSPLPFAIKEVWFNGLEEIKKVIKNDDLCGGLQGEYLSLLIQKRKIDHNVSFNGKAICVQDYSFLPHVSLAGGMSLTLMSPGVKDLENLLPTWEEKILEIGNDDDIKKRWEKDKRYKEPVPEIAKDDLLGGTLTIEELQDLRPDPDISPANRSSIAFMASFGGKTCLFAGDATSDCLLPAIDACKKKSGDDRFIIDAWKLAHHGSKKSTLESLMKKIDCKKMLISSDGKRYGHPDKECIAKLLKHSKPGLSFYFNYHSIHNEMWKDKELKNRYNYEAFYPVNEKEDGITIIL